MQFDPDDPRVLAYAAYGLRVNAVDVATALQWIDRAIALNPNSAAVQSASALAHAGRVDEARDMMANALRYRSRMTLERERRRALYKIRADYELLLEGARLAGLPD